RDEEAGEHHVGKEVAALDDAREAEQAARGDGGGNRLAPAPPVRRQEGEGDKREAERGMPGAERAVALALPRRDEGRGELLVAAEGDDLRGPCPPPMVLEDGVDPEARADREGEGEIERRPGVAAEQGASREIMARARRGGEQHDGAGDIG